MTKDEALKLALDSLIYASSYCDTYDAITAIKQALALDKMAENARELGLDYEPVLKDNSNYRLDPPEAEPAQRQWVGLTDEEIMEMYNEPRSDAEMIAFGREVEAKLKEKMQ